MTRHRDPRRVLVWLMVVACDTSETNETPTVEIDGEYLTVLSSATDVCGMSEILSN